MNKLHLLLWFLCEITRGVLLSSYRKTVALSQTRETLSVCLCKSSSQRNLLVETLAAEVIFKQIQDVFIEEEETLRNVIPCSERSC